MTVIFPMAGPDFIGSDGQLRALVATPSGPLFETLWRQRNYSKDNKFIFVFQQAHPYQDFLKTLNALGISYEFVTLSRLTQGAPWSALAGVPLALFPDEPVVVDLADIEFQGLDLEALARQKNADMVIPYFESDSPHYSYLQMLGTGQVQKVAEKEVISNQASAGVYFFKNLSTYLFALAGANGRTDFKRGSVAFVCPMANALIDLGSKVWGTPVLSKSVREYSLAFKENLSQFHKEAR